MRALRLVNFANEEDEAVVVEAGAEVVNARFARGAARREMDRAAIGAGVGGAIREV